VHISEKEAEAIAGFIGMKLPEFYENMTMPSDDGGVSLTENEDGNCPFYIDSPPGCRIYECRPLQCRTYPQKWNNPESECPQLR
jgi:Fe-S-cluster containining protein